MRTAPFKFMRIIRMHYIHALPAHSIAPSSHTRLMPSACSRACRPAHATGSGPGVRSLDVWPAAAADALLLVSVSVLVCQQQTATSRDVLHQVRQSRRGRRSSPRRVRGSAAARRRLTCCSVCFL